MTNNWLCYI